MTKPFDDDIQRLEGLIKGLNPVEEYISPEERQAGIVQVESSGRPNAIGDIGARAGESRGLMQIQKQTARDLLKQGKLPKVWNGKKVKKKDLPELLMDPDFNKQAGAALYEDNKNILRRKARNELQFTTEEQLDDLTTKAHNQGVRKTIDRDLLGKEPVNPKVQQYLEKVKARSKAFADGGLAQDNFSFDPEFQQPDPLMDISLGDLPPTDAPEASLEQEVNAPVLERSAGMPNVGGAANLSDPYRELLKQYEEEKKKRDEEIKNAELGNVGIDIANQLSHYMNMRNQGKLAQAGGFIPTPTQSLKVGKIDVPKEANLNEYLQKAKLMKELKGGTKATATKQIKTVDKDGNPITALIDGSGNVIKEFKNPASSKIASTKQIKTVDKDGNPITALIDASGNVIREFKGAKTAESTATKKINTVNDKGEAVTQLVDNRGEVVKEFKTPKKQITPYQEQSLALWKQSIGSKEERAEKARILREEKEQRIKQKQQQDREIKANENIYRVTKDFEGNKVKQEMDKQGISFEQANSLLKGIKSGNEIALGALGTKMARAMGEVGVLTDQDVVRYIQSQSILRQGKDVLERKGKGRLYKETLKDMEEVIQKMQKGFKKKEEDVYQRYTERAYQNFGKQAGLDRKEIYRRFGMGYKIPKKTPTEDQINKFTKMNPKLTREQATMILTNRLNK